MEYEDTRTIPTPEGVELQLRLAGVGSRFSAGLIDLAIQAALVAVTGLLAGLAGGGLAAGIILIVGVFLATVVYDVLFEVRAAGRTPGKRVLGLRVVLADGGPVGLRASAVRNLIRLIEGFALSYVPAILSILITRDNQRLGDLAAGTIVVRERRQAPVLPSPHVPATDPEADMSLWDVSAISAEEMATVRRFLDRRASLAPAARDRLALEMATRLGPTVVGPPRQWQAEAFLEYLVAAKAARG